MSEITGRADVVRFVRLQRTFNGIAVVAMALMIIGLIATFVVLIQQRNASVDSKKTLARVESCTTRDGTCYKELQSGGGSSRAVQQVVAGYLTIAKCDKVTDTPEQLEVCVKETTPKAPPARPALTPTPTPTEG